jgi:large subunit ribosomal protein L9
VKVILLQDVKGSGVKDQVINVNDGYARNYLFPRKWAMEATESALREIERRHETERRHAAEQRAIADEKVRSLKNKVITVSAKCGEKGRLYGSVTGQEIADALEKQHGIAIDKRKIEIAEPIHTIGNAEVTVWVYPGVTVKMTVHVVPAEG